MKSINTSAVKTLRAANIQDFKPGTVLIDSEGYDHVISEKYIDGIWNTRGSNVVFEIEARFYKIFA